METGQSPAKAVEHLRVEAARLMLEQGRHSMDEIADAVGFADRERMRRSFLRSIGQPPQAVRRSGKMSPSRLSKRGKSDGQENPGLGLSMTENLPAWARGRN